MSNTVPSPVKRKKPMLCGLLPGAILISAAFFIASAFVVVDFKVRFPGQQQVEVLQVKESITCQNECRLDGSEALPKGIVARTTDLQMHPLWGPAKKRKNPKSPMNLLAMAVGKKQKANVNEIVNKFPANDFIVMLFHYDGIVDDWKDLEWSSRAIHVSAFSQTKWWFAKRFLHPDVVSEYAYIFLWDEDLGVQNFDVGRYLSIVREEGLQISQPALDLDKSEVHHEITARQKGLDLHRRIEKVSRSGKKCYRNSTDPPCTGWVEMMAPVFSKASWRCTWYMIQNDLIHAWGLDMQLGYCAQGNRTQYIGIVDSEYLVHYGLPTLGGSAENKGNTEATQNASQTTALPTEELNVPSTSNKPDVRSEVRRQSFVELENFKRRWAKAVREDECWNDPYQQAEN